MRTASADGAHKSEGTVDHIAERTEVESILSSPGIDLETSGHRFLLLREAISESDLEPTCD